MATRKQGFASAVKNMGNPLNTQYTSALDQLEYEKVNVAPLCVKDLSGFMQPYILKKYDTINHLNNTIIRLSAELDKQLLQLKEKKAKQTDFDQYKQKLQQLTLLQHEKIELALSALTDLRQTRNQILTRQYIEERKQDENIHEAVLNTKQQTIDNVPKPFTTQDLLLNINSHAASGLLGNSLNLAIKDKDIFDTKARITFDSDEVSDKEFGGRLTLITDPQCILPQLQQTQKIVLSCLGGYVMLNEKPYLQQDEVVCSSFAEVQFMFRDDASSYKRYQDNKTQLLKELQEQFRLATKKVESLIQKIDKDDKEKKMRQRMKIGQIIQNGCIPLFSVMDQNNSSDTSFTMSQVSQTERNAGVISTTQQNQEHTSILIEDEQKEDDVAPVVVNSTNQLNKDVAQSPAVDVQKSYQQQQTPTVVQKAEQHQQLVFQQMKQQVQQQQQQQQLLQQQQQQQQLLLQKQQMVNTQAVKSENEEYNANYCVFNMCHGSEDDSEMVACESGENCKYARDGWFHPICLGFAIEDIRKGVFDECEFFCPGCWVDGGKPYNQWGETLNVGKKRIAAIRKSIYEVWLQQYGQNLRKK